MHGPGIKQQIILAYTGDHGGITFTQQGSQPVFLVGGDCQQGRRKHLAGLGTTTDSAMARLQFNRYAQPR